MAGRSRRSSDRPVVAFAEQQAMQRTMNYVCCTYTLHGDAGSSCGLIDTHDADWFCAVQDPIMGEYPSLTNAVSGRSSWTASIQSSGQCPTAWISRRSTSPTARGPAGTDGARYVAPAVAAAGTGGGDQCRGDGSLTLPLDVGDFFGASAHLRRRLFVLHFERELGCRSMARQREGRRVAGACLRRARSARTHTG